MRKRRLTHEQILDIKKWLSTEKLLRHLKCPFIKPMSRYTPPECERVCKPYFPRIWEEECCPCNRYNEDEMLMIINSMLKDTEEQELKYE